jgi:Kef-type K+ transport system membrane component KefB
VETFIAGAALSATSLGTTFSVISSASKEVDLSQTMVGSVLVSAAVIDDVVGLVLARLVHPAHFHHFIIAHVYLTVSSTT